MVGGCDWNPDERGVAPLTDLIRNDGCPIPESVKGFVIRFGVTDKHGHELDGDWDEKGKNGCDHRDTPEWKAAHRPPRKEPPTMPTIPSVSPVPESIPPEPVVALALNDTPAIPTVESVGVDSAIAQVKSLVPADTSPGLLIGGAALLAVLGAAFKFGPGVLKARTERAQQAHELELEKLRLEREKSEKQDDQHKACATERAALEAKVAALTARIEDLSAKAEKAGAAALNLGDLDPEAIEERLAAIEKKLKPAARSRTRKQV